MIPSSLDGVDVKMVVGSVTTFAALTNEKCVVAWGSSHAIGTSYQHPLPSLKNIKTIFSTGSAFAALTNENSVVAWGSSSNGGNVPTSISIIKKYKNNIFN